MSDSSDDQGVGRDGPQTVEWLRPALESLEMVTVRRHRRGAKWSMLQIRAYTSYPSHAPIRDDVDGSVSIHTGDFSLRVAWWLI